MGSRGWHGGVKTPELAIGGAGLPGCRASVQSSRCSCILMGHFALIKNCRNELLLMNGFHFLANLIYWSKWKAKYREFPYIPHPPHPPISRFLTPCSWVLHLSEWINQHCYIIVNSSPQFIRGLPLGGVHSVGLDKCMTCPIIISEYLHCPENPPFYAYSPPQFVWNSSNSAIQLMYYVCLCIYHTHTLLGLYAHV